MPLYPNEAQLSRCTYTAPLSLAMEVMLKAYYTDGREEERGVNIPAFQVAHIPIMVASKCCHTWKLTREACKALQEDSPKSGEWVIEWLQKEIPIKDYALILGKGLDQ